MSSTAVREILVGSRAPESTAGRRISVAELRKAWNAALAPEAGDTAGWPLSTGEAQRFLDLPGSDLTYYARRLLANIHDEIPALLGGEPTGAAVPLAPAGARLPVYINAAGFPVAAPHITGRPTHAQAEEAFYRLGLLISHATFSGGTLPGWGALNLPAKATLVDNAVHMARASLTAPNGKLDGLSKDETAQLRSSAFTTLFALAKILAPVGHTAALRVRVHQALLELARGETHKLLGKHMSRLLDRDDYRNGLKSAQKREVDELFALRHPQKLDVGNILDADGYIAWDHVSGEGENFFRSDVVKFAEMSIAGATFRKVRTRGGVVDFELTFSSSRGQGGRVKGVRLSVREFANDMFDSLGSRKGFSYGGHSQLGANQELSVERALLRGLKANTPQIGLLDLCAGLDNLDADVKALGEVEILTTFSSSYFSTGTLRDEHGSFKGVTSSEGTDSLKELLDGLSREENYTQLRKRVAEVIYGWEHSRNPNVVFPTPTDYREVRWMHLDGDSDGRMDAEDVFFQFGLLRATAQHEREFELRTSQRDDRLNGDAIRDAVLDLNVATHYNSVTSPNDRVTHRFSGGGFFDGDGASDLVRFAEGRNHDGKSIIRVLVNSKLGHTSREAMAALVQYSAMMYAADQGLVTLSEVDRKLMALTFAVYRLNYDALNRTHDQRIWRQLLQVMRLPSALPYGALADLVDAEQHDYAGNLTIVRKFKALLSAAAKEALASSSVGRPAASSLVA